MKRLVLFLTLNHPLWGRCFIWQRVHRMDKKTLSQISGLALLTAGELVFRLFFSACHKLSARRYSRDVFGSDPDSFYSVYDRRQFRGVTRYGFGNPARREHFRPNITPVSVFHKRNGSAVCPFGPAVLPVSAQEKAR